MELFVIGILLGLIGIVVGVQGYFNSRRIKQSILEVVGRDLAISIEALDPDKRYIIALPSSMSEEEFTEAFEVLRNHLDLENSKTHIVIMHGSVKIIEFS